MIQSLKERRVLMATTEIVLAAADTSAAILFGVLEDGRVRPR